MTETEYKKELKRRKSAVNQAIENVPAVRYGECGTNGRAAWDAVADALLQYRTLVAIHKVMPAKFQ